MKKIMREITCGFVDKNPGFFCFIGEEDMYKQNYGIDHPVASQFPVTSLMSK